MQRKPLLNLMHHVFVYGTLKQGFANFHINAGQRIPGNFRTVQRYPLLIIAQAFLPWLLNQPGSGEQVLGQVFQVNDQVLKEMDQLEQVDEDGWYTRSEIWVQRMDAPNYSPVSAFVYFGADQRVAGELVHAGPLAEFTAEHNLGYLNAA
jgi:gamma-glutamylaminecyclotransferase